MTQKDLDLPHLFNKFLKVLIEHFGLNSQEYKCSQEALDNSDAFFLRRMLEILTKAFLLKMLIFLTFLFMSITMPQLVFLTFRLKLKIHIFKNIFTSLLLNRIAKSVKIT